MSSAFANFSKFSFLLFSNKGANLKRPFKRPVLITFGRGLILIIEDDWNLGRFRRFSFFPEMHDKLK